MASSRPNSNRITKAEAKVHTRWMASLSVKFDPTKAVPKVVKNSAKANATAASATAGDDPAVAALQSSLAEVNAKKQGNT
jgi:RNA polymerase II elongation factor ELL